MSGSQNLDPLKSQTDLPEDEIELIDLLRVLWKWKYLIIGGTLVCTIAAIGISYFMPKIYLIEMVIKPGILTINDDGTNVYFDTSGNIKAAIEAGAFDNLILKDLEEKNVENIPRKLIFKISTARNSGILTVEFESSMVKQGIEILNSMTQVLTREYGEIAKNYIADIDRDIRIAEASIEKLERDKNSVQTNINNIERRIIESQSEVAVINENTEFLSKERNKFLSNMRDSKNILPALLYSNSLQQNLELANIYKDQINSYKIHKESELQKISRLQNDTQNQSTLIESLRFKKNNIQSIQIIQPPSSSPKPIKPKKKLILILAAFIGIFMMVFLSFLLEYISGNRKKITLKF